MSGDIDDKLLTFAINDKKLYFSVATLLTQENVKLV